MVHSFSIPLKPSDEAVVKFLMSLVFGSQKKLLNMQNKRECLRHDVIGANKLIFWILENDKKNRKSFSSVCNLVYGNALVLSSQVARLLFDAIRAKEMVSFSSFIDEDRKRHTKDQIEKALREEEYTTPKKKRRSKTMGPDANDDFMVASPVLIRQALLQNITMPDVVSTQKEVNPFPDDDLAPVTEQQLEMLYGLLDETDRPSSSNQKSTSIMDRTFTDRYNSDDNHRNRYPEIDYELQRPTEEFIQEQQQTPRKPMLLEEAFEPAPQLAEILMYGRLPIMAEEERRKSLEDEMEEARNHAINSDFQTPRQHNMDFQSDIDYRKDFDIARLPSEIQLDEIADIPRPVSKTPRSAAKNRRGSNTDEMDGVNNRVPLRDMHRRMEDFSSLHYSDAAPLLHKNRSGMTLQELMNPVPYQFRQKANKTLWEPFRLLPKKLQFGISVDVSDEESESTTGKNRPPDFDLEQLDPINLSQMKIMATPLKENTPCTTPRRPPDFEMREEIEYPRNFEEHFEKTITASPLIPRSKTPVLFEELDIPSREFIRSPINSSDGEEITPTVRICEKLIEKCQKNSPFAFHFESALSSKATRREAARTFYVVLELLKERQLVAEQKGPFMTIELMINSADSDDLDEIIGN